MSAAIYLGVLFFKLTCNQATTPPSEEIHLEE